MKLKNTSEIINRIIPHRNPLVTNLTWRRMGIIKLSNELTKEILGGVREYRAVRNNILLRKANLLDTFKEESAFFLMPFKDRLRK